MAEYKQQLHDKLQSAQKRLATSREMKALKASAPSLFEIIDGEISLELNKIYGDKALSQEEYLESHGYVRGLKRIRNLIDAKEVDETQASQEVNVIQGQLEDFKQDNNAQKSK